MTYDETLDQSFEVDDTEETVQPVPADTFNAGDTASDLTPVQPLPFGQAFASEDDTLVAVQPLPLGPVFASPSGVDEETDQDSGASDNVVDVHPQIINTNAVVEDNADLAAVQPLPLGPTYAVETSSANTPVSVDPLGYFASDDSSETSVAAMTATTDGTLTAGTFTSFEANILDSKVKVLAESDSKSSVYVSKYLPTDMASGPTVTAKGGGGDVEATADGEVLQSTNWHYAAGGYYDKMKIISDGLLVTDADQLTINAEDEGHTVYYNEWWTSGSHHFTNHHYYTAIDASNANGYVTYQGVTKDHWQGETSLTGKSYNFHNTFKGGDFGNHITGGNYADTLIGGAGDDTIYGVGGNNKIYGVGGDNSIFGGTGNDIIFGGTGNDYIDTGTGNNIVVLQSGDNIVIAPQNAIDGTSTTTYTNQIVAGSGNDTFVIGNIPSAVTTVEHFGYDGIDILQDAGVSVGESIIDFGVEALEMTPIAGFFTTGILSMLESFIGGTPADVIQETSWGDYHTSHIYNFNPVTDRLLLPMNPDGDYNLQFDAASSTLDGYAFQVVDKNGDPASDASSWSTMLEVGYASGSAIFGDWHTDTLSMDEIKGFNESLMANAFSMDGDHVYFAGNEVSSTTLESLTGFAMSDELGTSRFALAGAWSGYFIQGGIDSSFVMGTNNSDALFGYDITNYMDPTGDAKTYFGFEGDNLFGGAFADNTFIGGSGDNTVSYQYYSAEMIGDSSDTTSVHIEVDMSNTYSSSSFGDSYGDYYQVVTYGGIGGATSHVDKAFNVQNIVGSQGNDILIGNDLDNTFYSTGSADSDDGLTAGVNLWTGTGGSNTFYLNGGNVEITDFTAGDDTIIIEQDAYFDVSSDYSADLNWVETDDAWMLFDSSDLDPTLPQALLTLDKGAGFTGPMDIDVYVSDGTTDHFTPGVSTFASLGIDLVV